MLGEGVWCRNHHRPTSAGHEASFCVEPSPLGRAIDEFGRALFTWCLCNRSWQNTVFAVACLSPVVHPRWEDSVLEAIQRLIAPYLSQVHACLWHRMPPPPKFPHLDKAVALLPEGAREQFNQNLAAAPAVPWTCSPALSDGRENEEVLHTVTHTCC